VIRAFESVFAYLLRRMLRQQFMKKLYGAVSSHTRRPNHHIRQSKEKNRKRELKGLGYISSSPQTREADCQPFWESPQYIVDSFSH
jgi:ribosomal protein S19E (S16A)